MKYKITSKHDCTIAFMFKENLITKISSLRQIEYFCAHYRNYKNLFNKFMRCN